MKKVILLVLHLSALNTFAQYTLAPEIWSIPEKVTAISEWQNRSESPSISFDKTKLYFDGIAVTEWADTGWGIPTLLPSHINQHLARWPSISTNGNRIFFTWFWPGWDLYYSDWDSTTNNWGPAISCGPNVNTPELAENTGSMPNDTTLIFLRTTVAHISYWNSQTQTWGPAERWPKPTLWFVSDLGLYVSPNFKKAYYAKTRPDTTIGGEWYLNYDIAVSYKDTNNPMGYKPPQILNFCLYSDTQYFAGNYVDRLEGFPSLTPDGKRMYLTTTYDGQTTIYESIMLIDENGNPVKVEEVRTDLSPSGLELLPAYPNPFNPTTNFGFRISETGYITLKVYDVLGRRIAELISEEKQTGEYKVSFNAEDYNLSSGAYIVVLSLKDKYLKTTEQHLAQKIIYIK